MATISDQAKQVAEKYVKHIRSKLDIDRAVLFGSVARGAADKDSDIDLIIISNQFKKMNLAKRLTLLSHLRGREFLNWPMDILGYTADEFDELSKVSTMFAEAKSQGIVIR